MKNRTITSRFLEVAVQILGLGWLSGRALDSGASCPGFEPHDHVLKQETLRFPKHS